MPLDPPKWASADEVSSYGWAFLSLFKNRQHFEYSQRTGSIALPSSDRRKAQLRADPLKKQRVHLRQRLSNARCSIKDAQQKLSQAREDLARDNGPFGWEVNETIKKQTDRLVQLTAAQQRAALDLELFDLLNPRTTNCDRS